MTGLCPTYIRDACVEREAFSAREAPSRVRSVSEMNHTCTIAGFDSGAGFFTGFADEHVCRTYKLAAASC